MMQVHFLPYTSNAANSGKTISDAQTVSNQKEDSTVEDHSGFLLRIDESHFKDHGNLIPSDKIIDFIAPKLCGLNQPRFVVLDIPLQALSFTINENIDEIYNRGVNFSINLLNLLFPILQQRSKKLFPGKGYAVSGPHRIPHKGDKPLHPLHWDSLNAPVLVLTYNIDSTLQGGRPIIADLGKFMKENPGEYSFGIYPPRIFENINVHNRLIENYSYPVSIGPDKVTIVILNNSIDLVEKDGILHGAEAAKGTGTRRITRTVIYDLNYGFDIERPYVPPQFERYMKEEKDRFKGFFVAREGHFINSNEV